MDNIKRRLNNLYRLNEKITNKLEDIENEVYNLDKIYQRNKKNNSKIFFIENKEYAIECYKNKKLEDLYIIYFEWCKKHKVKAMYYDEFIKNINAIAQKQIPLEDLLKFPTNPEIISKLCEKLNINAKKGHTITQAVSIAETYCYSIFPNADKMLVGLFENFAQFYQCFFHSRKDLEEALKRISCKQIENIGQIGYEEK